MKPTVAWIGDEDGHLELLDQTLLPERQVVLELRDAAGVIDSIQRLAVRGAPAIGVAAAYGVVLGVRERRETVGDAATPVESRRQEFLQTVAAVADRLAAARPTAVNLGWAVARMRTAAAREPTLHGLLAEARAIHDEDVELCRRIGAAGAGLIADGATVLTHCNAGRLATAGDGTALAVLFAAWREGRRFRVLADETRPLLQGARLTALELAEAGIPVEVIADSAAAGLIARGEVDLIVTGADRIASNGDVANKVGTYGLALAAAAHGVPMWVAAPTSTFDLAIPDGSHIPIEDRDPGEVLELGSRRVAAAGGTGAAGASAAVGARNPAFDVTPARLLRGLVTDRGRIEPVTAERVKEVLSGGR